MHALVDVVAIVFLALCVRAQERAADPVANKENPEAPEWKARPEGQTETGLNPTEAFSSSDFGFEGAIDWDVGQGGTSATIVETGTTTAQNRASITVRYGTQSATANEAAAVKIQATSGGSTKTKLRTVFKVTWSAPNFANNHDADNKLLHPAYTFFSAHPVRIFS